MEKKRLEPKAFTPTMGAYSHGLAVDTAGSRWIFVTGQIAVDQQGKLVSDDVGDQTRYVFENIRKILAEGDATFDDVVKVQIFVTDIKDFAVISPIRNEYLGQSEPVSTFLEVSGFVKPGCKIEIEVIAGAKQKTD